MKDLKIENRKTLLTEELYPEVDYELLTKKEKSKIDNDEVDDKYRWINKDQLNDIVEGRGYKTSQDLIPNIDRDVACFMDCNCRSECACRKDCGCKADCGCKKQTG